jgi:hypothetical protein
MKATKQVRDLRIGLKIKRRIDDSAPLHIIHQEKIKRDALEPRN